MSDGHERPPRRVNADSRTEILEATLRVVSAAGVDGLTHRAIAQEAQLSPGLTTYYFESLEDILSSAIDLAMFRDKKRITTWVDGLTDGADLPVELTKFVFTLLVNEPDSVYVNFVLVLAAVKREHLRAKAHEWGAWLAKELSRGMTLQAANSVAIAFDGTLLRMAMTGSRANRSEIIESFRRACGESSRWHKIRAR